MIQSIIHYIAGGIVPIRRCIFILCVCMVSAMQTFGQFAPVAGSPGTTAIHYDSSAITAWATGCSIQRGYRDVAVPDSGYATIGDSSAAIGRATTNNVVSLGDGGSAILTFAKPITNGQGFDFAVFENGFAAGSAGMAFLELAFVEVSSDGVRYVRFPATDNVQDTIQLGNGGFSDGSKLNNLAGKYTFGYGTPFDLDELKDSAGLDVTSITHVKVIDVIGTINPTHASHDSRGLKINDPYPTNFASSGFDLDAVGVMHEKTANSIANISNDDVIQLFPNPTSRFINIKSKAAGNSELSIAELSGRIIQTATFEGEFRLNISLLPTGIYSIRIIDQDHVFSKLIVKE